MSWQQTTTVETGCAPWSHVIRYSKYINHSNRSLECSILWHGILLYCICSKDSTQYSLLAIHYLGIHYPVIITQYSLLIILSQLFITRYLLPSIQRSFFQAAVASILLYGCSTWTLRKRLEKKLDGNYTRMLRAILNKSRRQHPTIHQLYSHLPPITKTIQVRRTRHAGHCWRSRDELISDLLIWTPTYDRTKARTYIQQLCEDTGRSPEDLAEAMNNREKWRERVRDIRATSTT